MQIPNDYTLFSHTSRSIGKRLHLPPTWCREVFCGFIDLRNDCAGQYSIRLGLLRRWLRLAQIQGTFLI